MPLSVLVIDGHPPVEQFGQRLRVERGFDLDREERFRLIEQKAAIPIRRGNKRGAGIGCEGQGAPFHVFRAAEQCL